MDHIEPLPEAETSFDGELQEFEGSSLPLDDPLVQNRERKGRPARPQGEEPQADA
jgi:hypothetical protein